VRYFPPFFLTAICLFGISSCSPNRQTKIGGAILVQLPIYSPEQGYFLAPTEIKTLTNIDRLEGTSAQFYVEAKADLNNMTGHAPQIRTVKSKSGVHVATDVYSLQLLTLYHHLEKLREMDVKYKVWGDAVQKPRKVAVFLPMVDDSGRAEVNARYSGELDAVLFSPFPDQSLPLMANGGVIAHEHFHSFFYKQVIQELKDKFPKEETDRDVYHRYLFSALNEGLADVWGWAYSGDDDFVRRSIPRESYLRKMDTPLVKVQSAQDIFHNAVRDPKSFYSLGTQFAKFIRLMAVNESRNRFEAADLARKWVVQFLPQIKERYLNLNEDTLWDPNDILVSFAANALIEKTKSCSKLEKYLQQDQAKILCKSKASP
jgi:hypothetical protein